MHEIEIVETAQARFYRFSDFFAGFGGLSTDMGLIWGLQRRVSDLARGTSGRNLRQNLDQIFGPKMGRNFQPDSGEVLDFQFWSEDGSTLVLSFGQALVEVADDKFSFATASSTAARQSQMKPG